jgi:hypothetical protein
MTLYQSHRAGMPIVVTGNKDEQLEEVPRSTKSQVNRGKKHQQRAHHVLHKLDSIFGAAKPDNYDSSETLPELPSRQGSILVSLPTLERLNTFADTFNE